MVPFARFARAHKDKVRRREDEEGIAPLLTDHMVVQLLGSAGNFVKILWEETVSFDPSDARAPRQVPCQKNAGRITGACETMRRHAEQLRRNLHLAYDGLSKAPECLLFLVTVLSNVRSRRPGGPGRRRLGIRAFEFARGDIFHRSNLCHFERAIQEGRDFAAEKRPNEITLSEASRLGRIPIPRHVLTRAANKAATEPGFLPSRPVGRNRLVDKAVAQKFYEDHDARRRLKLLGPFPEKTAKW